MAHSDAEASFAAPSLGIWSASKIGCWLAPVCADYTTSQPRTLASSTSNGTASSHKKEVDAESNLFRRISEAVEAKLEDALGSEKVKAAFRDVHVTVDGNASDKEKQDVRNKAIKAGLLPGFEDQASQVKMVSRTEAAAIAVLSQFTEDGCEHSSRLRNGDQVLVCQCGGNSVDAITYSITETSKL
jgi:hypothetical protein